MSTATTGHLSFTSALVRTSAPLGVIREELGRRRYGGVPNEPGWGSLWDGTEDVINEILANSRPGGQPERIVSEPPYPDHLQARLYWDEPDRTLVKYAGSSASAASTHMLRAADIVFAEWDADQLLLLMGERKEASLRSWVVPQIDQALKAVDPSATVVRGDSPLAFGSDDDFFRWLFYRSTHDKVLNNDLKLIELTSLSNKDAQRRPTRMRRSVKLDRNAALALLLEKGTRFGPATVLVESKALALDVCFEVTPEGQFSVFRGQSGYKMEDGETEIAAEVGLRLVRDVAFEVIPELKRLHNTDLKWPAVNRAAFTAEAKALMKTDLGL